MTNETIDAKIPKKLAEFIDSLIKEGYFTSKEDFVKTAVGMAAELYGFSGTRKEGKTLLEAIRQAGGEPGTIKPVPVIPAIKTEPLTDEEQDVLDILTGSKFEFEEALHAKYTMDALRFGKSPLPLSEFQKLLEKLAEKGRIKKSKHENKVVWKRVD
ncbi:MAG: hypothetical protein GF308_04095 [Candidatus Heimdallarchaeota archaeon]|nr:hypothetical protein [Candidatus Heimdallarchaeota archaeon]